MTKKEEKQLRKEIGLILYYKKRIDITRVDEILSLIQSEKQELERENETLRKQNLEAIREDKQDEINPRNYQPK